MLVYSIESVVHLRFLLVVWVNHSEQRFQVLRVLVRHFYGIARNLVKLNWELLQELTSSLTAQLDENSQALFHAILKRCVELLRAQQDLL